MAMAFQYQLSTAVGQEHIFSPLLVLKYGIDCSPVCLPGTRRISVRYTQSVSEVRPSALRSILNIAYDDA
ncbi:UNVERIFIED_CONTAM: hypothetical protein Sangu_2660600 [Sesamum angustifolium]|uniref:Uncharacterized protein n=1 Tax=Sesamum angustifolium TaxID=2727405 RepID=A0AAW2J254_9LAMI